ncbi:MAG: helix-turn-helix transcriptional regulator [Rhizobiales bacterium]|nr:helix-turn-helix transcriptional regulator [Hyphomicrobiales bacterium]OJY40849.1 MAG: transcriptional regulator [Rhizobiales bacterium 64-17]
MSEQWQEIGNRLRAYRLGKNFTASDMAEKIGVSRAALYRLEKGELVKIETLEKLAELLEVSLPSLMGVGVEYYNNAVAFFERMRQLEENVLQVLGNFTPISFLLLSDDYIDHLRTMLLESNGTANEDRAWFADYVERVLSVLKERRGSTPKRNPTVVSVINTQTIERFLRSGLIGRYDLSAAVMRKRRALARREVERLVEIFRKQPIGVQIGVVENFAAEQTFQVFEKSDATFVTMSPYRLGDHPNISAGIAMVTSAPEAVRMFKDSIVEQWDRAQKGEAGARSLEALLARTPL